MSWDLRERMTARPSDVESQVSAPAPPSAGITDQLSLSLRSVIGRTRFSRRGSRMPHWTRCPRRVSRTALDEYRGCSEDFSVIESRCVDRTTHSGGRGRNATSRSKNRKVSGQSLPCRLVLAANGAEIRRAACCGRTREARRLERVRGSAAVVDSRQRGTIRWQRFSHHLLEAWHASILVVALHRRC